MKARVGSLIPRITPGTTFGSADAILSVWPPAAEGVWVLPTVTLAPCRAELGASWYPGAEPGGGGYVAQNMLATKDERQRGAAPLLQRGPLRAEELALGRDGPARSRLWGIRSRRRGGGSGPELRADDGRLSACGPPRIDARPFCAAYMSTQATQMNWGRAISSTISTGVSAQGSIRDYFWFTPGDVRHPVLSIVVTVFMNQISKVWELLLTLGAGTGLVSILRWYWWRVNAWSEVSHGLRSGDVGPAAPGLRPATPRGFALNLILTTAVTTVVWP